MEPFPGRRPVLSSPSDRLGGRIRGQARLLGKPVHAPPMNKNRQLPQKHGEKSDHSQSIAWICDRLAQPTPKALSLRWSAERSMPTNSAVREILPENRLIWAIR